MTTRLMIFTMQRSREYPLNLYLYDGCSVVAGGSDHLGGDVRVPGYPTAANLGAGVRHLDDGLVLTKVPHHGLPSGRGGRHDVLNLCVEVDNTS